MVNRSGKLVPFKTSVIVLAVILFVGTVLTAFGYYENNEVALYLGVIITLIGVMIGLLRIIVQSKVRSAESRLN